MRPNLRGSPFLAGFLRGLLSLSYAFILNTKSFRRVWRRLNRLRRASRAQTCTLRNHQSDILKSLEVKAHQPLRKNRHHAHQFSVPRRHLRHFPLSR
jgi:hypothetical protein